MQFKVIKFDDYSGEERKRILLSMPTWWGANKSFKSVYKLTNSDISILIYAVALRDAGDGLRFSRVDVVDLMMIARGWCRGYCSQIFNSMMNRGFLQMSGGASKRSRTAFCELTTLGNTAYREFLSVYSDRCDKFLAIADDLGSPGLRLRLKDLHLNAQI